MTALGTEPLAPDDRSVAPAFGPAAGDQAADVVVIGGGYTGLWAAWRAAEAGATVALVEAHAIGWGASGRNAAHVVPSFGAISPAQLVAMFGAPGERMCAAIAESARRLFRFIADEAIDCAARPVGQLGLAAAPPTLAAAEALAGQWQAAGGAVRAIDADEARRDVRSRRYLGGLLFEDGGTLDPLAYAVGLAHACARAGVALFEQSRVTAIAEDAHGVTVSTAGARFRARAVVMATNGYTDRLWPGLSRVGYSLPVGMLASQPLSPEQATILPSGRPFGDLDDRTLFSGVLDAKQRYRVSVLPTARRPTLARLGAIVDAKFRRAFPGTPPPRWERHWFGRILVTPTGAPLLIPLSGRIVAGLGCNGYGICASYLLGDALARLAGGRATTALDLPVAPFKAARLAAASPALARFVMTPFARVLRD